MRPAYPRRPASLLALVVVFTFLAALLVPGCGSGRRAGSPDDDDDDSSSPDDDDASDDDDDGSGDDDDGSGDDDDFTPPAGSTTLITFHPDNHALMVVDPDTGNGTAVAEFSDETIICSSVFSRGGTLYVSGGGMLFTVDICAGTLLEIGTYPGNISACGISTDDLSSLYGINDETDELIRIDTLTADITPIGPLGVNFGAHGLTWDGQRGAFIAINGSDDRIYSVDPDTGEATVLSNLVDFNFEGVGVEIDPISGQLYACTQGNLLAIDPETGVVDVIGNIHDYDCNNLGATHLDIPCLDP